MRGHAGEADWVPSFQRVCIECLEPVGLADLLTQWVGSMTQSANLNQGGHLVLAVVRWPSIRQDHVVPLSTSQLGDWQ